MVNAKITDPCDNHSDDEEAFLPLYTYLALAPGERDAEFDAALERFCQSPTQRPASTSPFVRSVVSTSWAR